MPSIRIALCLTGLLAPITAWPQASNSTVRGSVADTQQAVIPSAKVLLTNTATGVARESVTNSAGLYVFPGVTPGALSTQGRTRRAADIRRLVDGTGATGRDR